MIQYYNGENYFDDEEIEYYLTNNGSNKSNYKCNNQSHTLKGVNDSTTALSDEGTDAVACISKQKYNTRNDELTVQNISDNSVNKNNSKHIRLENKKHTSLKTSNFLNIDDHKFEGEYNKITSKKCDRKPKHGGIRAKVLKYVYKLGN